MKIYMVEEGMIVDDFDDIGGNIGFTETWDSQSKFIYDAETRKFFLDREKAESYVSKEVQDSMPMSYGVVVCAEEELTDADIENIEQRNSLEEYDFLNSGDYEVVYSVYNNYGKLKENFH